MTFRTFLGATAAVAGLAVGGYFVATSSPSNKGTACNAQAWAAITPAMTTNNQALGAEQKVFPGQLIAGDGGVFEKPYMWGKNPDGSPRGLLQYLRAKGPVLNINARCTAPTASGGGSAAIVGPSGAPDSPVEGQTWKSPGGTCYVFTRGAWLAIMCPAGA